MNGDPERNKEALEFIVPASALFSETLRVQAVEEFGEEGAWLVLSQLVYGWRAYFDIACAVTGAGRLSESTDSRPTPPDIEFQIVKDLQVQGLLYSAAEQLAGVVCAAQAHVAGTATFLDSYTAHHDVGSLIRDAHAISRQDIGELVGENLIEATEFPSSETARVVDLEPTAMEVVDVGGLYVPRSVIDANAREGSVEKAHAVVDLIRNTLDQLRPLIDEPRLGETNPRSRPLREVDNSFRHGLRVLFHSATPNERRFRALSGDRADIESHAVDVYMPPRGNGDSIRYATLGCSPSRTAEHIESLRQVSVRIGQFLRGFIGARCNGDARLLLAAVHLDIGQSE